MGTFCSKTKPLIFLFYVALGMPEGATLHPNVKQSKNKEKEERKKRRGGEKRGQFNN